MSIVDELRYSNFRGNEYRSVIDRFVKYLSEGGNGELARMLVANRNDADERIANARVKR